MTWKNWPLQKLVGWVETTLVDWILRILHCWKRKIRVQEAEVMFPPHPSLLFDWEEWRC